MKLDLRYLTSDTDRHGNARLYVRRHGRRVRIREPLGTPAFLSAYTAALDALAHPGGTKQRIRTTAAPHGSLGWLGASYFASTEFRTLDPTSQQTRRLILEECFREPRKPGSADLMRDCPLSAFSTAHVLVLRDRRADKRGAANNRLKYLSALFGWAIEARLITRNPAREARPLKYASSGFYTWTVEDVRRFEEWHAVGTKARLALALLLFTGVRRGDLVGLGRQHVRDGWLRFVPRKTRYKRRTLSEKPIIQQLADIIAASPTGNLTFLVTEYGKPFTAAGFGAWFRKRCNEAGLPQCTAHGLRKAGAVLMAEAGATDRELMAAYDWVTASQATVYTEAANKKKLAGAMKLLGAK